MPSAWVQHVQKTYRAGKAGGLSYKQAMIKAKGTWKKGGKASKAKASKAEAKEEKAEDEEAEEKPKRRRRKKKAQ